MLKKFIFGLFAFVLVTTFSIPTYAAISSSVGVRVVYSASNVGISTWTPIVTSTVKAIKGISVFNSSISPIEVGMATAGSSAGTEVRQFLVPGRPQTFGAAPSTFFPMVAGQTMRISIRALDSASTTGEGEFNLFYN